MKLFFKKHMDTIGITMGAIIFVGLGFMAQRLLSFDRDCLRFDGVIELHVDGFVESAVSCKKTSRFETTSYSDEFKFYIEVINELNRIEVLFPQALRGVFVTITKKDPFFLLASERSLVIGEEIARNKKALQRIILNAVTFQSLGGLETIGKEVRADLLWYLFAGDEEWMDPTMGIRVDPKKWMKLSALPIRVEDYCATPIRQIYDLSFCRYELDKSQSLPLRKRVQPLVSWTAFQVLKSNGLVSSTSYLRSLFSENSSAELSIEIPNEDDVVSLEVIESFVREEVLRLLDGRPKVRAPAYDETKYDRLISRVWKEHKVTTSADFDFVVEVDSAHLRDEVLNSLTEWQKHSLEGLSSKILVIFEDSQLELPLAQAVHYPLDIVQSHTHLLLACQLPGVQSIGDFQAENLIALKVCDSQDLPKWAEILKEGELNKTAYLKLHIPSFKRWSRHAEHVIAKNRSMDSVFCASNLHAGYPFSVKNCPTHVSR